MPEDDLPRRIILSRKGVDDAAGGFASPILNGNRLFTIPIPDCGTGITYADLRFADGSSGVNKLVSDLSANENLAVSEVHLDPDLRASSVTRSAFHPAFGQCGSEQTHLENRGVKEEPGQQINDLFLFFGYFRPAKFNRDKGRWEYVGSCKLHVIHAWLQLGKIHRVNAPDPAWCRHPHGIPSFLVAADQQRRSQAKQNNTIYTPRRHLTFLPDVPGHGTFTSFDCHDSGHSLRLTDPGSKQRSTWKLPMFFYKKLSHIGEKATWERRGQHCRLTRRGYGQEFVFEVPQSGQDRAKVLNWLISLPFATTAVSACGLVS
ncbi:MAG: hypothetical protein ABSD98_15340 [Candidatus Korobacteraceae bacterium]|jgi:putative DNA base modification enzyme with NMAD domain